MTVSISPKANFLSKTLNKDEYLTRLNEVLRRYSAPFDDVELVGNISHIDAVSLEKGKLRTLLADAQYEYDTFHPGDYKTPGAGGYQLTHKYYLFMKVTNGMREMEFSTFFRRLRRLMRLIEKHGHKYNIVKYTYNWD